MSAGQESTEVVHGHEDEHVHTLEWPETLRIALVALAAAVTRLLVAPASPFVLVAQWMITPAPRTAGSMPSPRRRSPVKNATCG